MIQKQTLQNNSETEKVYQINNDGTINSLGRKISEYDPDLGLIEYGYDANGNLVWENFKY